MCDKALEPAYMFPTNKREPGSQERVADLEHNIKTYQTEVYISALEVTETFHNHLFFLTRKINKMNDT